MSRPVVGLGTRLGLVCALGSAPVAVACVGRHSADAGDSGADAVAVEEVVDAGPPDVRADAVAAARTAFAKGELDPPRVGAMNFQTSVLSTTAWPDSDGGVVGTRLGYLRHGANVPVVPVEPIVNDECPDGWFELIEGGFVCGKYATLDLKNPRVRLAPAPPRTDAGLPYRYGYNVADGTPLYRRVLSPEDRKKHEGFRAPSPPEDAGSSGSTAAGSSEEEAHESTAPDESATNGSTPSSPATSSDRAATLSAGTRPSTSARHARHDPRRHAPERRPPLLTLGDLHGRGVLVRKMVRGFYLALDREFKAAHARWWRTTAGFAVPWERVAVQPALTDFHGLWIPPLAGEGDAGKKRGNGTVAFVKSPSAVKYLVDLETKKVTWGEQLPKRSAVELTGETFNTGVVLHETTAGFWIRLGDTITTTPGKPPADAAPGEKWIDVDLAKQMLVAMEGETPVFATLVSTGRRNLVEKDHDYPTPPGSYRIREKHITANMDGNVAAGLPYSIEDGPWVMYFEGSFALHGAFWHANFGHQVSHGCINLAPEDARTIFGWIEPRLPQGWHGVFATPENPGTRVVVREDPKAPK